jgi:hypothetical protein
MKIQIITSEEDLEDKLTEVRETVNGDLFESVFDEQTSRLGRVIKHKGEYYVNPY